MCCWVFFAPKAPHISPPPLRAADPPALAADVGAAEAAPGAGAPGASAGAPGQPQAPQLEVLRGPRPRKKTTSHLTAPS